MLLLVSKMLFQASCCAFLSALYR